MRARLLIGTLLLTIAATAALFVPAAIALAHAEGEAQVVELQSETVDAAVRLQQAVSGETDDGERADGPDEAPSDELSEHGEAVLDTHSFALYDQAGERVVGDGPDRLEDPLDPALSGATTSARVGELQVVAIPLAGGGVLRGAEPTSEADDRTRAAVARLALNAVLVLIGGAVAAWLLARRLTEPLRQLGRSAVRLGAGDFTATAPTTGVAEIDEVADALNSSADRIGTLVERERLLTADTTHQLRTPITGLRLALEGELASPREDPTEVLVEALGAVDRLEATVTSLTDLARDLAPSAPFRIDAAVDTAVRHWTPAFARAGREVQAGEVCTAASSARRVAVETILDVLLENALRHGAGAVVIDASRAGTGVRLTVSDEGSCLLDDDRLFARHESGGGGTGIGLHLARTLAAAEGARLRLVSADPTVFQLVLPVTESEDA